MKKILALVMAMIMAAIALVACSNDTPEEPDEPAFIYDRVVLIGVDGAGAFFNKTDTPNIDRMFADGAITYEMWSTSPSSSAPNWGSMLHGVEPEFHQLDNDIAASYAYNPESLYPSIFRVVRDAYPDATLASFCTWNPINIGIIEDNIGVHKDTADNDGLLTGKIVDYLKENDPKLLFIHYDECDGVGHSTGYGLDEHLKQITTIDGYIGQVYDTLAELGRVENTLFIVTTDHGGTTLGSHGGSSDAEMKNMFAVAGKSVIKGGDIKGVTETGKEWGMEIRDTASVVLYAFGLEQPSTWTSIVPNNMFEGSVTTVRPEYVLEYEYAHRTHESVPTPDADVVDVLGEDRILSYLNFDGEIVEAMGTEVSVKGTEKFLSGYYGKAAKMDDLAVRLDDIWPDMSSFSVAMWFNSKGTSGSASLVSNKNWAASNSDGFILSLQPSSVLFNLGDGTNEMNVEYPLPADFRNGWVHVILSVDREANTISFAYDFGEFVTTEIPDELKGASFDGSAGFVIGQDATRNYKTSLKAMVDDFVVVNGTITQEDIAALAAYYGVEK